MTTFETKALYMSILTSPPVLYKMRSPRVWIEILFKRTRWHLKNKDMDINVGPTHSAICSLHWTQWSIPNIWCPGLNSIAYCVYSILHSLANVSEFSSTSVAVMTCNHLWFCTCRSPCQLLKFSSPGFGWIYCQKTHSFTSHGIQITLSVNLKVLHII